MKKLLGPFATVWVGLSTHKLRSFLTMLGIIIGVASVISLMSIGRGAQADILSRIETLGSDRITIRPGRVTSGGVRGAAGGANTLTLADAEAIVGQISYISSVAPSYSRNMQLIAGSKNTNASVIGTTADYIQISNLKLASGTFLSKFDYQYGTAVIVLGSEVKEELFGEASAIGQEVRIGTNVVRVIGVLESKGSTYGSPDDNTFIPLTTMQQMIAQPRNSQGERLISTIDLSVSDENQAGYVVEQMTSLLRTRHGLSPSADDDFRIRSMQEISETMQQTTDTLTILLGAIAAIALLVGGIGVMNIMLVSVLERTREIGIRKALGAREQDIWIQFLLEAALLTFAGGIIGVIVGWAVALVLPRIVQMTTVVSTDIVILAVSVSIGIGLFFGFYPAWNASRLNPIEALRSE
ncbi:ABC transporter permease [Chloroflexota bacterium]